MSGKGKLASQDDLEALQKRINLIESNQQTSMGVVFEALDKVSQAEAHTSGTVKNMLDVQKVDHALLQELQQQNSRLEMKLDQILGQLTRLGGDAASPKRISNRPSLQAKRE